MNTRSLMISLLLAGGLALPATAQEEGQAEGQEEGYFAVEGDTFEQEAEEAPPAEVDETYFYDKMAPYGDWIWTPEHGWVWHPREIWDDWRPYTYGRWVYTEFGWTWSSYFAWGWAPFHYGTWSFLDYIGWVWVPGRVWGPAWVMWRHSDVYVGWAPILAGYDYWYGWAYYPVYYGHWTFINWGHFCDPHPHHHYVDRRRVHHAFRHTYFPRRCRNRSAGDCHQGPRRELVRKRINKPVELARVKNVELRPRGSKPQPLGMENGVLQIHRPRQIKPVRTVEMTKRAPGQRARVKDFGIVESGRRPAVVRDRAIPQPKPGTRPAAQIGERRRPEPGKVIRPSQPAPSLPGMRRSPIKSRPTPQVRTPSPRSTPRVNFPSSHSVPGPSSTPRVRTPSSHSTPRVRTPSSHSTPRVRTPSSHSTPRVRTPSSHSTPRVRSTPSRSKSSSNSRSFSRPSSSRSSSSRSSSSKSSSSRSSSSKSSSSRSSSGSRRRR